MKTSTPLGTLDMIPVGDFLAVSLPSPLSLLIPQSHFSFCNSRLDVVDGDLIRFDDAVSGRLNTERSSRCVSRLTRARRGMERKFGAVDCRLSGSSWKLRYCVSTRLVDRSNLVGVSRASICVSKISVAISSASRIPCRLLRSFAQSVIAHPRRVSEASPHKMRRLWPFAASSNFEFQNLLSVSSFLHCSPSRITRRHRRHSARALHPVVVRYSREPVESPE